MRYSAPLCPDFIPPSIGKARLLHKHAAVLYLSRGTGLGTGQHTESRHLTCLSQVDHNLMRIGRAVRRLPESALLQVEHLVGGTVAAVGLLTVGIHDLP